MQKRRLYVWGGITVACLFAAVLALNKVLPYGFEQRKEIRAIQLQSHLLAWRSAGAPEAQLLVDKGETQMAKLSEFRTNIQVGGTDFVTVLRLDSPEFQGRGYLVGTTNADIIWIDKNGEAKLLRRKPVG